MNSISVDIGGVKLDIRFEGEDSPRFMETVTGKFSDYISLDKGAEVPLVVRQHSDIPLKSLLNGDEIKALGEYFLKVEGRFPFSQLSSRWKRGRVKAAPERPPDGDVVFSVFPQLIPLFNKDRIAVLYHESFLLLINYEVPSAEVIALDSDFTENVTAVSLIIQATAGLLAPLYHGMMLHACSLVINDGGYVFFGGSGAGKSTIAGLAGGESLLSDDGTLCFRNGGGYYVTPSPFTQVSNRGNIGSSVPVKGLFFLVKDEDNFIERIAPGEAMLRILHNHIHFFRYLPERETESTFLSVREIVERFPFYNLHFTREIEPLKFFREREDERKKVI